MGLTQVEKEGIETLINNNADNRVITGSGTANTLNGESSVVIDANGKLGVGTTSPGQPLHLKAASNATTLIQIEASPTGDGTAGFIGTIAAADNLNNGSLAGELALRGSSGISFSGNNGSATQLRLASGGNLTLTDGDLVIGTGGHGIDFSAQTATSTGSVTTDGEILDHYEECTFTPAVTGGLSGGTISYNSRSGRYTRIGDKVSFTFFMNISSCSLDAGQLTFGGLPFTSANDTNKAGAAWRIFYNGNIDSADSYKVNGNSTTIAVITAAGDARAANTTSIDAGNRQLSYWGFYFV